MNNNNYDGKKKRKGERENRTVHLNKAHHTPSYLYIWIHVIMKIFMFQKQKKKNRGRPHNETIMKRHFGRV